MAERITLADDGRDPWDRQPGESEKKHAYFQTYLQLGRTRTPKKTVEKLNEQAREAGAKELSRRTVQEDSYRHRWAERAAAFDRHMDAQWSKAVIEHGRRMVQEHLKTGRQLLAKAEKALEVITAEEMSPADAAKFIDLYSKLTRVALGEPETSVSVSGPKGGPVQITAVPGDEQAREAQLRAASLEVAQRLGLGVALAEMDEEAILDLPE
jgi:hypothetical protein